MSDVTAIFHITHFTNLAGIVGDGGLVCDRTAQTKNCVRIGYQHIKQRRLNRPVPLPPGGFVGDYVPFYFAPRSPMLYTIDRGNVEGYEGGQAQVIYLVSSAESVASANLRSVFTDGHAEMAPLTNFYNDLADLNKLNWNILRSKLWFDTDTEPDRKRRRQAEFLVHQFFPWELVDEIGVFDQAIAGQVRELLIESGHKPNVTIRRNWYF